MRELRDHPADEGRDSLVPSEEIELDRVGRIEIWRARGFSQRTVEEVLDRSDPPAAMALKSGRRGRIYRRPSAFGDLCIKEVVPSNPLRGLLALVRTGEARKAWQASWVLRHRGFPVPEPLLLAEERQSGILRRSWFVSRFLAGYLRLDRYYERIPTSLTPREKFAFIAALARFMRRFHDLGIYHRDLAPQNVLVKYDGELDDPSFQFALIDLESVDLGRRLTQDLIIRNLIQLSAMYPDPFSFRFRQRFLRAYTGGEGRLYEPDVLRLLRQRVLDKRAYCRLKFIEEHGHDGGQAGR